MDDRTDIVFRIHPYEYLDDHRDMAEFAGFTLASVLRYFVLKYPVSPLDVDKDDYLVNGVRINPHEYELQEYDEVRIIPGPRRERPPWPRSSMASLAPPIVEQPAAAHPPEEEQGEEMLGPSDVARILGCSYGEARQRMHDGRICAVKDGRWCRTRREWIDDYLGRFTIRPPKEEPAVATPPPRSKRLNHTAPVGEIAAEFLRERKG